MLQIWMRMQNVKRKKRGNKINELNCLIDKKLDELCDLVNMVKDINKNKKLK